MRVAQSRKRPLSIKARLYVFNTSEGWSRDVSEDVARELLGRATKEDKRLAGASRRFVELYLGEAEVLRAGIAD